MANTIFLPAIKAPSKTLNSSSALSFYVRTNLPSLSSVILARRCTKCTASEGRRSGTISSVNFTTFHILGTPLAIFIPITSLNLAELAQHKTIPLPTIYIEPRIDNKILLGCHPRKRRRSPSDLRRPHFIHSVTNMLGMGHRHGSILRQRTDGRDR